MQAGETYAGFWIRFVAFLVDSIAVTLVISPLAAVFIERPDASEALSAMLAGGSTGEILWQVALLVRPSGPADALLSMGLPAAGVVLFWIYRSATPGKMATRTRIEDADTGAPPTKLQCIVRYLGYFVSIFGLGLGFLWIAWDRRKQGWHDKLAGTVVVRMAPDATR